MEKGPRSYVRTEDGFSLVSLNTLTLWNGDVLTCSGKISSFVLDLLILSLLGGREGGKTSSMGLCNKLRRVWNGIALRLWIRKRGLLKLRHDVRACEYADVHVMWKMLRRNETETDQFSRKRENKSLWDCFNWARCTSIS
ncbi:hypothetical protein NC651_006063 [Populus alba x Populus x berolinensis]|nr:hypothetical protein NC651_006063 [Populus alba x Populus x berolinensis]